VSALPLNAGTANASFASSGVLFAVKYYGMLPNLLTCAVVLDGLIKCHFRFEAMLVFRAMEESDLDLDIVIYNVMIDGLCKDGKMSDSRKVLAVKALSFDSYTYEGLMDVHLIHALIMSLSRDCCQNVIF
jgi:hypothetical protein